jgi:hypothetical protein
MKKPTKLRTRHYYTAEDATKAVSKLELGVIILLALSVIEVIIVIVRYCF